MYPCHVICRVIAFLFEIPVVYLLSDHRSGLGIPRTVAEGIKKAKKFLDCLEECQLLGPNNMHYLLYLLREADNVQPLVERVESYIEKQDHVHLRYQRSNASRIGRIIKMYSANMMKSHSLKIKL